jgi:hypothetical protein
MRRKDMRRIILVAVLAVLALGYRWLKRENPRRQLDLSARNAPDLYDRPPGEHIYSPFAIEIEPMQGMVILDFDGHEVYQAIELQVFDHPDKGTGANVLLAHRQTGKIDFYFEPTVHLNRERANVGGGVGNWTPTPLKHHYRVTPAGLDAAVELTDLDGRHIALRITEQRRDRRPRLNMLAPMGGGIKAPTFLPFFYMHGMDLVRTAGTRFELTIDGQSFLPDKLPPVPHNRAPTYFARYCPDPLITFINPATDDVLTPLTPASSGIDQQGDTTYTLIDNAGHAEIQRITQRGNGHTVHLTFAPPVPDLASLREGGTVAGRFAIGTDSIEGVIAGDYSVARRGTQLHLTMHPTEDWWPRTGGLPARGTFMFFPATFRNWMQSYHWSATLEPSADGLRMTAHWDRRDPSA